MTAGDLLQRLWAPHRMAYVTGDDPSASEPGDECPFCRIPAEDSADSLVVARGAVAYAVLNLHPYNPGHLMVLPYRHVAEYEDLTLEEAADVALLTQQALRTLRRVSEPHGFNIGLNLGGVAGGSLSDHLHQHVVPRWSGDANFITIVGETKLLPQLLADTRDLLHTAWPSGS
ncbi:MAG: family hydrolase [Nocardioidaceae bacterium]|nr:family hydrolase [Nocardioidaceae bacterium]